ncbi:MAG: hypothetical protein V1743_07950 [Nanoarchaeota archaeon]
MIQELIAKTQNSHTILKKSISQLQSDFRDAHDLAMEIMPELSSLLEARDEDLFSEQNFLTARLVSSYNSDQLGASFGLASPGEYLYRIFHPKTHRTLRAANAIINKRYAALTQQYDGVDVILN